VEVDKMPELTVDDGRAPSALKRLVEDYLASCRAKGLSSKTVKDSYGYPLRDVFLPRCAREGITEASQLTGRILDRYSAQLQEQPGKRGRPLAKETAWTYVKAVRLLVAWAKREGEQIEGQAQLPKLAQHLPDILDRDEIRRMEDAAGNDRDQLIVRVLADTGIRNGELCGLRMQDLLERNRDHYLKVSGKGSKERLVPISPTLYRRIRR
jgi:integrase/recombinase XerD